MSYIAIIPPERASGEVLKMYQREQGGLDYLPNYAPLFSHRPQVLEAWACLQREVRCQMDARTYSLITLAAALAIRSSYCALAHARKLLARYFSESEMSGILRGDADSPLSPAERAMMRLARQVALDSSSVRAKDIQALGDCGLNDAAIFDVVAAAAARCFFAKVPDALGVRPDSALGDLPSPLLRLLTPGRAPEQCPPREPG